MSSSLYKPLFVHLVVPVNRQLSSSNPGILMPYVSSSYRLTRNTVVRSLLPSRATSLHPSASRDATPHSRNQKAPPTRNKPHIRSLTAAPALQSTTPNKASLRPTSRNSPPKPSATIPSSSRRCTSPKSDQLLAGRHRRPTVFTATACYFLQIRRRLRHHKRRGARHLRPAGRCCTCKKKPRMADVWARVRARPR